MNHRNLLLCLATLCTALAPAAHAARQPIIPSPAGNTWEYHAEAGLTLATGVENVIDQIQDNYGYERGTAWPIGLKLSAYAQNRDGFAFGGSIGPVSYFQVEDRTSNRRYRDDDYWSYIIPVSADLRYYLPSQGGIVPYGRLGVSFPFSGGDHLDSGTPGPVAAFGAQVWQHRILALGVEAGYDGSRVKVKSGPLGGAKRVTPVEFTFSVFVQF